MQGPNPRRPGARLVLAVVVALASGCLVRSGFEVEGHAEGDDRVFEPDTIETPVKAHLRDGSTLVFEDGAVLRRDSLVPRSDFGGRYDLALRPDGILAAVPLDSVVAFEAFRRDVDTEASLALTTAGIVGGGVVGGAVANSLLAAATFGSCPTFYAPGPTGEPELQAEAFSYSIAPLFEARDVDRLGTHPGEDGRLVLEGRNEALETHHINHLELLEVAHRRGERVVPDPEGRPLAVEDLRAPTGARDRAGRDVSGQLASDDGRAFATGRARLRTVDEDDYRDHVDLVFPAPGADSAGLVLRLRNSLLTTVLLYDLMLDDAGADALVWLGRDLNTVARALELGLWYRERMGLGVAVLEGGSYRPVDRVPDSGPIAWDEVGVVLPVPEGDTLRVRLSFVADAWRIDRAALAAGVRRPEGRRVAADRIEVAEGRVEGDALRVLREADDRYLETRPGQRFRVVFEVGPRAPVPATYLLAARGYYTEWVRTRWVRDGGEGVFEPSDAALVEAIRRWRDRREAFERRFFESRLPVR